MCFELCLRTKHVLELHSLAHPVSHVPPSPTHPSPPSQLQTVSDQQIPGTCCNHLGWVDVCLMVGIDTLVLLCSLFELLVGNVPLVFASLVVCVGALLAYIQLATIDIYNWATLGTLGLLSCIQKVPLTYALSANNCSVSLHNTLHLATLHSLCLV